MSAGFIGWPVQAAAPDGQPRTFKLHHSASGNLAVDGAGSVVHADDVIELSAVAGAARLGFRTRNGTKFILKQSVHHVLEFRALLI